MNTRQLVRICHALAFAATIFLTLLAPSCKKSATEPPDPNAPFVTPPGARLTQDGDASHIGWCASGTRIAYESQDLSGGIPAIGIIKSVDILTRRTQTLDGTSRDIYYFLVAGDSVFCDAQIVLFSGPGGTGFGEQVYTVSGYRPGGPAKPIGSGSFIAVSPDAQFLATLANNDTLEIVRLSDNALSKFPLLAGDFPLIFYPDSRQVLFTNGKLLNVVDGTWTLVPYPLPPSPVAWGSIRSGLYTVSLGRDSGVDTYMLNNLITGASTTIWRSTGDNTYPLGFMWSSDGKKLAFMRRSEPNGSPQTEYLYVCDIQSGKSSLITTVVAYRIGITSYSFSPDATKLAYAVRGDIYFSVL